MRKIFQITYSFHHTINVTFHSPTTPIRMACLHPRKGFNQKNFYSAPSVINYANKVCRSVIGSSRNYLHIEPTSKICTNDCTPKELYVRNDAGKVSRLLGLRSFCENSGNGEGIYMKISAVLPWIEHTVWP
jgi:hypothetical protein